MSAGKGSMPRPINKKRYDMNFDKIDWSKMRCKNGKALGCDCVRCPNLEEKKGGKEI